MDAQLARRAHGRRRGAGALGGGAAAGSALSLQASATARHPLPPASRDVLYVRGGAAVVAGRARVRRAPGRRLLDSRHPALRRHAAVRTTDKTYTLLYPLLDLTTTLDPRFTVAYRFGAIFLAEPYPGRTRPARPGDRAARERARAPTRSSGSTPRTRVRLLLVAAGLQGRGGVVRSRGRESTGAPWWLQLAGRHDARRGRRPAVVAAALAAAPRDRRPRLAAQQRAAEAGAARRARRDRRAGRRRPPIRPGAARPPADRGRARRERLAARACRLDPSGTPFVLDPARPAG